MMTDGEAVLQHMKLAAVESVEPVPIHRCPVCGELGECYNGIRASYHNCKWCGSIWQGHAA